MQEGGHLAARDVRARAIAAGCTSAGDAGLRHAIDVRFMDRVVVVGEIVARSGRKVEGASQEAGHLLTRHRCSRTEARRGASSRDARLGDAVDVPFVVGGVVVAEVVARGGGQVKRAGEEARHLLPAHCVVRAEQVGRAADRDALLVGPQDVIGEDRGADVVDAASSARLDCHRPTRRAETHARPRALVRLV